MVCFAPVVWAACAALNIHFPVRSSNKKGCAAQGKRIKRRQHKSNRQNPKNAWKASGAFGTWV
jgi:hypothetical protein